MRAWVPEATPAFEPHLRDVFRAGYEDRSATSEELNALFATHGNSVPLDAFNAAYQAEMRNTSSPIRQAWHQLFQTHSDLHSGWVPRAPVQHLCTGVNDSQVLPQIAINAGEAWNVTVLLLPDLVHVRALGP